MIALSSINKQYGSRTLYSNASFTVDAGEKIGLVGPNGAGKTTLFRIIMGEEGVDSGTINVSDKLQIGYFSQSVGEMRGKSALEEVKAAAGRVSDLSIKLAAFEKKLADSAENPISDDDMATLLEQYGETQLEFEQRGGYDLDSRAKEILTGLGIGPGDYDRKTETFSGGWKMRIALAKILILNPDVLLMDEPTNYLDMESIIWLEQWLIDFKGALVMTSHDREFMNRIVKKIVEVAAKNITAYSGNYDYYLREREIRKDQLLAAHQKQQDMLAKEEEFIARFKARASHAAQVQSRVKKLEKIDRIEIPAEERVMSFEFPKPPRGGDDVFRMKDLAKSWIDEAGNEKKVFSGLSGTVKRLNRVAVVGVNGAGKSTLLKIMAGMTDPTTGFSQIGPSTLVGYFSQYSLETLNRNKTVYDEIHDRIPDATLGYVRNLLGAFLFSGDDVDKKVGVLSGGEKSRLVLATILARPINFLILDEPTNHLDIKSREVLIEALKSFEGTSVIVSHDRHFLKQVTNRVFEMHHGECRIYEGTYTEFLAKSGK